MKLARDRGRHRGGKVFALNLALAALAALAIGGLWAYRELQIRNNQQALNELVRTVDARIAEIEAKKKEPVYIALPGAVKIQAPVENYEDPTSIWTLVNKERTLPTEYVPLELGVTDLPTRSNATDNEKRVRQTIVGPLAQLFEAAQGDGHSLMIGSAYRSAVTQGQLFDAYVTRVGYEEANKYSAHPGHSEHQTGLAVDISSTSQQCYLSECFINTADGKWLDDNAFKYGFTLRYPKGKEEITGYNFEPWHYRYVGINLATALHQSGLTLDEAWTYLEAALTTLRKNRAI